MELVTWICVCISEVMWSLYNIKEEKKTFSFPIYGLF